MRLTLIALALGLVAACGDAVTEPAEATWEFEHAEADGALVSVWGSGPDDVWAAGGQAGQGLLLHYDGSEWREVYTGTSGFVWWVYGFRADDIYAVGERGLLLHYDGDTWQQVDSGTDKTLYGVWGESGDEVWIVGGEPNGEPGSAVVLRGKGTSFAPVTDIPVNLMPDVLYKIYGFHEQKLIAVGSGGTVLRFDGETWEREPVPTDEPLFSLWGRGSDDLYAVGGYGAGEVLHYDGSEWRPATTARLRSGLSGVYTAPGHPTIAVGSDSYVVEILDGGTAAEPDIPAMMPVPTLHGVWGDGNGTTYAVGGDLTSYPGPMGGVILRRSAR